MSNIMNTFTTLLARSWKFFIQFKVPIVIGALIFTAVTVLADGFFLNQEDRVTREMMMRLGIEDARFDELDKRMQQGDETAFDEMLKDMEMVGQMFEEMPEDVQLEFLAEWSKKMTIGLLPMTFMMAIVVALIFVLSSAFYYVLIIKQIRDPLKVARMSVTKVIPFLGVGIWIMLRSFLWVPVLNIFTGIYYFPRMVFSGVILFKEDLGVIDSVKASMDRTKGNWFSVLTQYIMLFAVLVAVSAILSMAVRFTGPLNNFLLILIGQMLSAFALIFTVFYSEKFSVSVKPTAKAIPLTKSSARGQSSQSRQKRPASTKPRQ